MAPQRRLRKRCKRLTEGTSIVSSTSGLSALSHRRSLQKLPSNRLDFDDMEAELGGGLLEQFDLLAAVPVLIILHSFVDVILSVLQHPVHYARKLVGHRGDRLRRSEPSSQATVLGS